MNEKEILETIQSFANELEEYEDEMQLIHALQGLLNLYQKEKEKNRILENKLKTFIKILKE